MTRKIIIGTRGSALALRQTELVRQRLAEVAPEWEVEVRTIRTLPDRAPNVPIERLGRTGVFVREVEDKLLAGEITIAVHSLKDLYTALPEGLCLAAVPMRDDPRDVLVSREGRRLDELPPGAVVGTGSPRRQAQLRHVRPDLEFVAIRGNLDTRLRKLHDEGLDAIVLAAAGLHRMGLTNVITEYLPVDLCTPAAGQGALAVEARRDDPLVELLRQINDPDAEAAALAERKAMAELGGGCVAPVGLYARVVGHEIEIHGVVAAPDGSRLVRRSVRGPADQPAEAGAELARELLAAGGAEILRAIGRGPAAGV